MFIKIRLLECYIFIFVLEYMLLMCMVEDIGDGRDDEKSCKLIVWGFKGWIVLQFF